MNSAFISGKNAVPIEFNDESFSNAVMARPDFSGTNIPIPFKALLIEQNCEAIEVVNYVI